MLPLRHHLGLSSASRPLRACRRFTASSVFIASGFPAALAPYGILRRDWVVRDVLNNRLLSTPRTRRPLILHGRAGIGKSCALEIVAAHFSEQPPMPRGPPMLLLHLRSLWDMVRGVYPYGRRACNYQEFEVPLFTSKLLASILDSCPAESLDAIPLSRDYSAVAPPQLTAKAKPHGKPSDTQLSASNTLFKAGSPPSKVLHLGVAAPALSTRASEIFFAEIALRKDVVLAVDQVNLLFAQTNYCDEESQPLSAGRFCLSRQLRPFFEGSTRATVIGAETTEFPDRLPFDDSAPEHESRWTFSTTRSGDGFYPSAVDRIRVPEYSSEEVKLIVDRYHATGLINPVHVGSKIAPENSYHAGLFNVANFTDPNRLRLLSAGNPRKLFEYCKNPRPI